MVLKEFLAFSGGKVSIKAPMKAHLSRIICVRDQLEQASPETMNLAIAVLSQSSREIRQDQHQ